MLQTHSVNLLRTSLAINNQRQDSYIQNKRMLELLKSGVLAEPVLVGRERELEELQKHLDLAVQGRGTTVFVSGEAGSGKTRLVNEFLCSSRQKRDVTELAGWCLSNSGVPYFPFIEAFNTYFPSFGKKSRDISSQQDALQQDEELGLKAWLMGPEKLHSLGEPGNLPTEEVGLRGRVMGTGKFESFGKLEVLSPQAWKDSTFAAVTKALLSIAAKKPTVLFIDDLRMQSGSLKKLKE